MKQDNVIQTKSFAFAVRVVRMCRFLANEKSEYVLSKHLLRSGTLHWLRLIKETDYLTETQFDSI